MYGINQEWDTHTIKYFKSLDEIKKQLRKGNEGYLAKHPEVRAIIRVFIAEIVGAKPEQLYDFISQLFHCNNTPELVFKVNQQLKRVLEYMKNSHWCEYDGDKLFSPAESTHSLLSKSSISEDINQLLSVACITPKPKNGHYHSCHSK